MLSSSLNDFLTRHKLPESYREDTQRWFVPLANELVRIKRLQCKTLVVGINGAQGSGKSTLADLLALTLNTEHGLNVATLSIDDFYFTHQQRQKLSADIHPLLATRGVPGTHDVELAIKTIQSLCKNKSTLIPRFDKSTDDRVPESEWDLMRSKADIIIFEGWCVGATALPIDRLQHPVNALERNEDPNGIWRKYFNLQLKDIYPPLFSLIDTLIMLKAPSFDSVYNWRLEQEEKLKSSLIDNQQSTLKLMDEASLKRFVQHYQSITEYLLEALPETADYLFELNEDRTVVSSRGQSQNQ